MDTENWTQITKSTHVKAIDYDLGNWLLKVEFSNGAIYEYYDVPPQIVDGLLARENLPEGKPGKFFYHNIRKAGYKYKQIREKS